MTGNLVMGREVGQEVVIGDPGNPLATVTVVDIRGDKVRRAIRADRAIPIHRREVADAIAAGSPDRKNPIAPAQFGGNDGGVADPQAG